MNKLLLTTMAALLLGVPTALADPSLVDRMVAVVNKDIILRSEVDEVLVMVEEDQLRGLSGEERTKEKRELELQILDGLIDEQLVTQAMDRAEIGVEDQEVETAIADVASQNKISVETLVDELAKQGIAMVEYRSDLKEQLRQYKFMNLEIRSRVKVSEEDLRNHYNQVQASADPDPAWKLRRLFLKYPSGADAEAKELIDHEADALLGSIRGGQSFAGVARLRSDDEATKESGGDAGLVKPSDLAPIFADALRGVETGTPVLVRTPMGPFLVVVEGIENTAVRPFEEVRDDLMRQLYDEAMQREMELWTGEERRRAHIEVLL